ncbi:MAG TPA: hypothetical protein PKE26_05270 [Kiritimatiellia bacterium]|nr:hypothetical protein [Kiritimatiellia bacterium]HMO98503.1 hypothetical protein [Kiritimatiellia bacterium]HMP95811.1 hypothetical protein [Kiritimatiellia bacterium]
MNTIFDANTALLPLGFWARTTPDLTPISEAATILVAGAIISSLIWGVSLIVQAKIKYRK